MMQLGRGERSVSCVRQDKARQTFGANFSDGNTNFVGEAKFVVSTSDDVHSPP